MLPIQKRFLPFTKLIDFNFYYHRTKAKISWSLKHAGFNSTDSNVVDFGQDSFDIMSHLQQNDMVGLERYVREKMTKVRFTSFAPAEQYVNEHGKIVKMLNGNWRVIVNVNGVKCLCYNTKRDLAVRDAAVQLQQEFPEITQ